MKPGYDYDSPQSVYKLGRCYKTLPDFVPDLDGFVLHSKAKPTDFLSTSLTSRGYIINEKVKNILQNFKLPLHAFYPIELRYKKQLVDKYYWLHVICDLTGIVDYSASTFFIYKDYSYDLGVIKVSSKEELLQKRSVIEEKNKGHNVTIWAKSLRLIEKVEYDFFKIGIYDSNKYISQKLYDTFNQEKTTGITVKPLSWEFY